jgi:hypothetical protein
MPWRASASLPRAVGAKRRVRVKDAVIANSTEQLGVGKGREALKDDGRRRSRVLLEHRHDVVLETAESRAPAGPLVSGRLAKGE